MIKCLFEDMTHLFENQEGYKVKFDSGAYYLGESKQNEEWIKHGIGKYMYDDGPTMLVPGLRITWTA
jgi:hypothetical protein